MISLNYIPIDAFSNVNCEQVFKPIPTWVLGIYNRDTCNITFIALPG